MPRPIFSCSKYASSTRGRLPATHRRLILGLGGAGELAYMHRLRHGRVRVEVTAEN